MSLEPIHRDGTVRQDTVGGPAAVPTTRLYFPVLGALLALGFSLTLLSWGVLNGVWLA
jgi:hypothetical protein